MKIKIYVEVNKDIVDMGKGSVLLLPLAVVQKVLYASNCGMYTK